MPLLDHFRLPVRARAAWPSVSGSWVHLVMAQLNATLPPQYAAQGRSHLGAEAEADISEFVAPGKWPPPDAEGGVAVAPPLGRVETIVLDEFEVEVLDTVDDMRLVGVIEFVSPRNKDRPRARRRLVSKCLSYLDLGVGLILVDVVTSRTGNVHNELLAELGESTELLLSQGQPYLAGYRPSKDGDRWGIDVWPYSVPIGTPMPAVPLAIKDGPLVPVDFETTYMQALSVHRL